MPRPQKRPKERRLVGIRPREATLLLTGRDTHGVPPFGRPMGQRFNPREAWEENRDALMEYWIQDEEGWESAWWMQPRPPGPGHRPWAWWVFDAEEPRRMIVDGEPVEWLGEPWAEGARKVWNRKAGDTWYLRDRRAFHLGRPHSSSWYPTFSDTQWESEPDYLDRLDLLTPDEPKKLHR